MKAQVLLPPSSARFSVSWPDPTPPALAGRYFPLSTWRAQGGSELPRVREAGPRARRPGGRGDGWAGSACPRQRWSVWGTGGAARPRQVPAQKWLSLGAVPFPSTLRAAWEG